MRITLCVLYVYAYTLAIAIVYHVSWLYSSRICARSFTTANTLPYPETKGTAQNERELMDAMILTRATGASVQKREG